MDSVEENENVEVAVKFAEIKEATANALEASGRSAEAQRCLERALMHLHDGYDDSFRGRLFARLDELMVEAWEAAVLRSEERKVIVAPDGALSMEVERGSEDVERRFSVRSLVPMASVRLKWETRRQYFKIAGVYELDGQDDDGSDSEPRTAQTSSLMDTKCILVNRLQALYAYEVVVAFSAQTCGQFEQTVIFRFKGSHPMTVQLSAKVFQLHEGNEIQAFKNCKEPQPLSSNDIDQNESGQIMATHQTVKPCFDNDGVFFSHHCYEVRRHLHEFLQQEELECGKQLNKYRPIMWMQMFRSHFGLCAVLKMSQDLYRDTSCGRLVRDYCSIVKVRLWDEFDTIETPILKVFQNWIWLDMPLRYAYLENRVVKVDISFPYDRALFYNLQCAIGTVDNDVLRLLDEFPMRSITNDNYVDTFLKQMDAITELVHPDLDERQTEAFLRIIAQDANVPPLLVAGPAGTGKTFTLATAIIYLLQLDPDAKILVCTKSEESADEYVKNYLNSCSGVILRLCNLNRLVASVPKTVLQHCLLTKEPVENRAIFRSPSFEDVNSCRVVVTTYRTVALIDKLRPLVPFSHVFLDDAAQTTPVEAFVALCLLGPASRLVLAGDPTRWLSSPLHGLKNWKPLSLVARCQGFNTGRYPRVQLDTSYLACQPIASLLGELFHKQSFKSQATSRNDGVIRGVAFYANFCKEERAIATTDDENEFVNLGQAHTALNVAKRLLAENKKRADTSDGLVAAKSGDSVGIISSYVDQTILIGRMIEAEGLDGVLSHHADDAQTMRFSATIVSTVCSSRTDQVDDDKLLYSALVACADLVVVVGDPVALCSRGTHGHLWTTYILAAERAGNLHGCKGQKLLDCHEMLLLNPDAEEFQPRGVPAETVLPPPPSLGVDGLSRLRFLLEEIEGLLPPDISLLNFLRQSPDVIEQWRHELYVMGGTRYGHRLDNILDNFAKLARDLNETSP